VRAADDHLANFVDWVAGCVLIYTTLFGVGKLLLKETALGLLLLGIAAVSAAIIYRHLSRRGWGSVAE
jgi:hypothetical protein